MIKKYWVLVLILIVGLVLRLSHNLGISMWHDEAFSALMIRYPWHEMFYRLSLDVHPPMYYIALRLWHYIFGDSMWSLRGFSIFFGVLTIPATYLLIKEAFRSTKMALWAALLVAISPFELTFSTEARMYTFGAFFAIMAALFLVRALRYGKWYNYLGFIVSTAIIILTHYYLLFTAAAMGLYALGYLFTHYKWNVKKYFPIIGSYVIILICFVPWLKIFLAQLKSVSASYWIPPMTWWSIPSTLWTILIGFANDTSKSGTQILLVITTLFTIYFLYKFLRKTQEAEKWLVFLALIMPFVGSVLFYLKSRSVYQDRYFLYAATFYSMAFAVWLSEIKIKWLSVTLFVVFVIINLAAVNNYWNGLDLAHHKGMADAAEYLLANIEPKQQIFVGTSFEFFNFKYYWSYKYSIPHNNDLVMLDPKLVIKDADTGYAFLGNNRPLLYTGGRSDISQMSSVEGVALLSNPDLAPTFTQNVHTGDTEWVVWTQAFGSNKPSLPANWTQINEQAFPDVRPYVGTVIYVSEYRVN